MKKRRPASTINLVPVGKISMAWIAGATVLMLAAGACVAWLQPWRLTEDEPAVDVRNELNARVVRALEGFEDPDAPLGTTGRLFCAVRILGTEPPAVSALPQVRTAYVWALCSTAHGNGEPDSGSSMPLAVRLADPVKVVGPGNGSLWEPDVRRIFPPHVQKLIFDNAYGSELEPALQQRMRQVS
ncbi:hypothetical protein [Krasilnikovia sp. MM14-A1004]|uniref:hypothetical protein n=1 Tax=Krasilnikovia sp. MM14-A1004 TaxID=3373541 RepID=UPI00399D5116